MILSRLAIKAYSAAAKCGNIRLGALARVLGSHHSLADGNVVHRIHPDRPGTANVQQSLDYRSLSWRADGVAFGVHVYIARKAAPQASFCCPFHRANLAALRSCISKTKAEQRLISEPACLSVSRTGLALESVLARSPAATRRMRRIAALVG